MGPKRRPVLWLAGAAVVGYLAIPVLQILTADWLKSHLPLLLDFLNWRWAPLVVTGIAFGLIAVAYRWPYLLRRPDSGQKSGGSHLPTPPQIPPTFQIGTQIGDIHYYNASGQRLPPGSHPQGPPAPPEEGPPRAEWMSQRHLKGRSFRLTDLPLENGDEGQAKQWIRGRIFEDCTIHGPAIIAPFGCNFGDSTFGVVDNSLDSILWPVGLDEERLSARLACMLAPSCDARSSVLESQER